MAKKTNNNYKNNNLISKYVKDNYKHFIIFLSVLFNIITLIALTCLAYCYFTGNIKLSDKAFIFANNVCSKNKQLEKSWADSNPEKVIKKVGYSINIYRVPNNFTESRCVVNGAYYTLVDYFYVDPQAATAAINTIDKEFLNGTEVVPILVGEDGKPLFGYFKTDEFNLPPVNK
jgi:hypothetical protein